MIPSAHHLDKGILAMGGYANAPVALSKEGAIKLYTIRVNGMQHKALAP